jgi:hypothetical protein
MHGLDGDEGRGGVHVAQVRDVAAVRAAAEAADDLDPGRRVRPQVAQHALGELAVADDDGATLAGVLAQQPAPALAQADHADGGERVGLRGPQA